MTQLPQPVPPMILVRILVGVIVILGFVAGYYHSAWQVELQKNQAAIDQQGTL